MGLLVDIGQRDSLSAGDLERRIVRDVRGELDAFLDFDVFPLHEEPGWREQVGCDAGVELVALAFARLRAAQLDGLAVDGFHRIDGEIQLASAPEASLVLGFDNRAAGGGALLEDQDAVHSNVFGDLHPDAIIDLGGRRRKRLGDPKPDFGAVGNDDMAGLGSGGQSDGKGKRKQGRELHGITSEMENGEIEKNCSVPTVYHIFN